MRIVFDLDGTLIDSAPDIRALANRLLADRGCAPLDLAETHSFIGNGAAVFVEKMREARALPECEQAALLAEFSAGYETAVELTRPYPGVVAALRALAAAGHALGICTNKPARPARAVLAHLGLLDGFATVVGGDSAATRKPDPAPLHQAFAALGAGPCLYVGDSEVDAETAQRAGIRFLLFTGGYRKSPVAAIPHAAAFTAFDALPGLVGAS
ncbi:phosphoglycolate phosphatase [Pseudooceanicola sp.]|uniref:phosphoglycolate phosphatase n=1 Tax=Pseudooceanicola sp. TaxID=1914328 RepID=UPI003512EAB6